ncbi:MAG: GDSL-type esterase/lipase family protein [Bacteroidales bacterium]|nr:GDSL-type esterase/lipase family protein [Bacteroidales bacterium]
MIKKIWLIAALAICGFGFAQEAQDSVDDQAEIRENPELGVSDGYVGAQDYSLYPFLHLSANRINLNGADWTDLRGRFDMCGDTVISIVHIGDSHIQAEGATSRTRALLQHNYGSAGRGLIIPFRLAGTNQPLDYKITSKSTFTVGKLMKHPWVVPMGFTGVSLQPDKKNFDFTISIVDSKEAEPDFDIVKMYKQGATPRLLSAISDNGFPALYNEFADQDTITIFLYEPVTSITLNFQCEEKCQIFGFKLENEMVGVEYSAIGNNGATFSSYNALGTLGNDLKTLSPNLVIVSLGANEAFGRVSDDDFYGQIDQLVSDVRIHNPQTEILLVTPSECQRSKTTRVGKGKNRKKVKTYSVNTNIPRLRNVILQYGRDHAVPTYDWYEVAGGTGSSQEWLLRKLMNTDRIHNTWSGYALQGDLLFDALNRTINSPSEIIVAETDE